MLKKFFLNLLSSFVGTWIALALFGAVVVLVIFGIIAKLGISAGGMGMSVNKGSVLTLQLSGEIIEREIPAEPNYVSLVVNDGITPYQTLVTIREALSAAKENKNISALYLKCQGASASPATLNSIRDAVKDFKESGKPVIAYSDGYTMGDYYIATEADELCLNPYGNVSLKGIGGTVLYFKGLLDKVGINVQVVKVGTYKSAVEPYILPEMSQPARQQLDTLYGNMWGIIKKGIAENRNISPASVIDTLVNKDYIFLKEGNACLKNHLVDRLIYERSMDSLIAVKIGIDKDKLNFISPEMLAGQEDFAASLSYKQQIPVLFATGEIIDGGGGSQIDYLQLVPIIVKLADDDKVKGMVLRVNSPGGSVYGSEQIGEALDYFQSKGKILAVSMGDYAASGGYWISSCANRIFADRLTITGSIGIFGLIPDISPLLDKVGVNPQVVSTNPQGAFPGLLTPMTPSQHEAMQEMVEDGYNKFVARVARGRHLSQEKVRIIGEGRVWDAIKAKQLGLVDEFGSLNDAVNWVATQCKLDNYGVPFYPELQTNIWNLLAQTGGVSFNEMIKEKMGTDYTLEAASRLYLLLQQPALQSRLPKMKVRFTDDLKNFY